MITSDFVIDTRNLSKVYNGVQALQSLDLQVPKHSIFGFLGPNGAGKTTAIKLLLGLTRPTTGSGAVFGQDIVQDSVEIRKRMGYLAQDPRFYGHMTARETLRFKARFYYRGPAAEIEKRIDETLELVGLSDKADRPDQGLFRRGAPAIGHRPGSDQLPRPVDPGRACCRTGPNGQAGRAGSDGTPAQIRHHFLLDPHPG